MVELILIQINVKRVLFTNSQIIVVFSCHQMFYLLVSWDRVMGPQTPYVP